MKSMYNEEYRYAEDANDLDIEATTRLKELFSKYMGVGFKYSPREIAHILVNAVHTLELEALLDMDFGLDNDGDENNEDYT